MRNLFLTGKKGIGKSTILKNALKQLNVSIGGYVTERILEGHYTKFIVKSLYDNVEEYTIIKVDTKNNSKKIYKDSFENGLVSILDKSFINRDLIVLDELGCAENNMDLFTSQVFKLLNSEKIVLGVLKDDNCNFLNKIRDRDDVLVIRVTEENRDYIHKEVVEILKGFYDK